MRTETVRMKRLEEVIVVTNQGKVIADGIENPTDVQVGQAIRKYARQFASAKRTTGKSSFKLMKPHPRIGAAKGERMTKTEWIKNNSIDDKMFEAIARAGYLMQL